MTPHAPPPSAKLQLQLQSPSRPQPQPQQREREQHVQGHGHDHVVSAAAGARAIVVLGCRVRLDPTGRLSGEVLRARVEAAAMEHARRGGAGAGVVLVVASGGRRWGEHVEADVIARELAILGVPEDAIVRERSSLSTRDNARFAAEALRRRGIGAATVVTSDWHLPRALALFRRTGLAVDGVPARAATAARRFSLSASARIWRAGRERLLTLLDLAAAAAATARAPRSRSR